MRLLLALLLTCSSMLTPAPGWADPSADPRGSSSTPDPQISPPANLRAFLMVPASDASLNKPLVRLTWNLSSDPGVDGYRIVLKVDGVQKLEDRVGPQEQSWTSPPIALQNPPPVVQVEAIRGEHLSEPVTREVPLTVGYMGLMAHPTAGSARELPAATVTALAEDPVTRHLWVGTSGGGLARLNPSTGESEWFTQLDGLGGNHVYALTFSQSLESGQLWVATDGGLTRLNTRGPRRRMETFDYQKDIYKELQPGPREITTLFEDLTGAVWIGTTGEGLIRFDPYTRSGRRLTTAEGLANDMVWAIVPDESGRKLWFGTNEGLSVYQIPLDSTVQPVRSALSVHSIARSRDNRMWLVTSDKIYEFIPENSQYQVRYSFHHADTPKSGLLVAAPEGELWVGTQAGLRHYRYGERVQDFSTLPVELSFEAPVPLGSTEVTALIRGHDGRLWVGLPDGGGVVHFDPETGASELFTGGNLSLQLQVNALQMDAQNHLWIATERGPIQMDARRNLVSLFSGQGGPASDELMAPAAVRAMATDDRGVMWLGLKHGGIVRYDSTSRRFRQLLPLPTRRQESPSVNRLIVTPSALFLGSDSAGVKVYGPSTGEEYIEQHLVDQELPSNRVLSMLLDQGTLWVGTGRGLIKAAVEGLPQDQLRLESDWSSTRSELPEALALSAIYDLALDPQKSLWVASALGLWRRRAPASTGSKGVWEQLLASSIDGEALAVTLDRQGQLWIGTNQGLYRSAQSPDHPDVFLEPIKVLSEAGKIRAILVDQNDVVWVGTERGLMLVPPFKNLQDSHPAREWTVALSLFTILGLFGLWWVRTFRHPVVMKVHQTADALTLFRLPELPRAVVALNRAHRLNATLLLLGLDASRWRRILRTAEVWPVSDTPLEPPQCDLIVGALMEVLNAEVLPLSSVRRAIEPRRLDTPLEMTTGEFPAVEPEPEIFAAPDADEISGESGHGGFDIGAPGNSEERVEISSDPVPMGAEGSSPSARDRTGTGERLPGEPAASTHLARPSMRDEGLRSHMRTMTPRLDAIDLGAPLPYAVRLPDLPIRLTNREVPLVVVRAPLPEEYPAAPLLNALQGLNLSQRYVLVLNLSSEPQLPVLNATGTRFVPLQEPDVRSLLFSLNPRTSFVRHFIRRVKMTEISPYSSKGEVSNPMMFVGRRIELDRISGNDRVNYSIVGARQIGKSSLMGALKRYYQNSRREVHAFTLTPQEDARGFYRRFSSLIKSDRIPRDSTEFAEMMEAHYRNVQPPALFLIDEVDGLLARERVAGYPVLTAMRRLQQQEICSFVIAGYWQLYQLTNDYHSPLYNMAEVIELGPLKQDEARDLIVSPMERMGLSFEKRAVVQEIIDAAAGHPYLIQFICNQLLEQMTASHPPIYTAADWHAVQDSDELKRYVERNFKSNAGPLDELIIYATVAALRFTHPQLEHALTALGVNIPLRSREESLRKLKLVGILRETEGRFEYSLPLFRRMLLKENIGYFAEARARELREGKLA